MARTSGNTPTERFLNRLARRSFLSLWSYPAPFRDQGTKKRGGEGAELCDLLVVFDNHVLIFSDKDCDFQAIPNVELAWRRWYTKTIQRSADQIWGAERWLRQFPGRVFLDRACTQLLPIPIPEPENAVFHRIVVAHDSTGRRRQIIGGSGSLLVDPELLGNAHLLSLAEGGRPFSVGQVDPDRGYIHVFDEATLGRVMRTLDTITDFVNYLTRKEEFIVSGRLLGAFGEEDLLAYYLSNLNEFETHDFVLPNNADKLWLQEGHWEAYIQKPEVSLKAKIDRVSYIWDELIETVAGYAVEGKLLFQTDRDITRHEQFLRTLAREPRIRRRMLARDLMGKVTSPLEPGYCSFVMVEPSSSGDPHYVFVVAAPPDRVRVGTDRWERHRDFRREVLRMYCMAAMHHYKDQAEAIVGIATEHGSAHGRTFDLVGLNRRDWDEEMNAEALQILGRTGWFQNRRFRRGIENEYPQVKNRVEGDAPQSPSVGRNQPCPCGSGKKYKKCHGVLQQ